MAEEVSYPSTGRKFSRHGHVFQLKVLMLFMSRGCKKGYQFHLGTEIEGAKAFDDIMFKYKNANGESEYRFIQAKHKLKEIELIKYSDILGEAKEDKKGDFHLLKYFESYLTIKQNGKANGLFPDLKLKDLILYTNIGFDDAELKNKGISLKQSDKDDILNDEKIGAKIPQHYKFINFPEVEKEKFYHADASYQMAKRLTECVVNKKPIDLNYALFKKYHRALCLENIIDISTKKIHDKFIFEEEISASAKAFRKKFLVAGLQTNESEDDFWKKIKCKDLNLSKSFGQDDDEAECQLPNDCVTDDLINEFLNLLVFAVHQPNEKQLDDIIKKELREEFNLLNSAEIDNKFYRYMWEWMTESHGRFLSNQNMQDFFENSKKQMQKFKIIGVTSDIEEKNLKFGDFYEDVSEMKTHLESEECVLQIVSPECTSLAFVKFVQVLDNKQIDSFAATSMKNLIANQEKFLEVFDSDESFTLVIEWKSERMTEEQTKKIYEKAEQLFQIFNRKIKPEKKQKLILITSQDVRVNHIISRFSLPLKIAHANKIDFCDLTDSTKTRILSKNVNFQDSKITLENLLENELNIISNRLLDKIINEGEICIGTRATSLGEIEAYYIERSFQLHQLYTTEFFSEKNNEDVYVVAGTTKMELSQSLSKEKICDFGDHEYRNKACNIIIIIYQAQFLDICKYLSGKNIHLFVKVLDKFQWMQSVGKTFNIASENDLITDIINEKVKVIVGEPGIGKTTVFKSIAIKLKEKFTNFWVIFTSLGECKSQIDNHNLESVENVINFIIAIQKLDDGIEQQMLKERIMSSGKIILLLDGFDDIDSSLQAKIKLMLNSLKATKLACVWISARSQFQNELVETPAEHVYMLRHFGMEDYKTLLKAYWKRSINPITDRQLYILGIYTESLLQHFIESTKFQASEILRIPLHAHMLAEVYRDDVERFLKSETVYLDQKILSISIPNLIPPTPLVQQIVCDVEFNLLELYRQFVKNKFRLCVQDRMSFDDEIVNEMFEVFTVELTKQHEIIAFNTLFGTTDVTLENVDAGMQPVPKAMEKIGIIQTINGESRFLHRSYAEYFAAEKIAKCIRKHVTGTQKHDSLFLTLNNVILHESAEMLRQFLDVILASESEIHMAVLQDDEEKLQNIISENPDRISSRDLLGRTPFHYACQYNRVHIGNILISADPLCISAEDILDIGPVCYAITGASYLLLKCLLEEGRNNDKFSLTLKKVFEVLQMRTRNSLPITDTLCQFANDEQKDSIFSDCNYVKSFMETVESVHYKAYPAFFRFASKASQKKMILQDNCKIIKIWLVEDPVLVIESLRMCIDDEIKDQICNLDEYKNEFRKLNDASEYFRLFLLVQLLTRKQVDLIWTAEKYADYINYWICVHMNELRTTQNIGTIVGTIGYTSILLEIYNPVGQFEHIKFVEYFEALISYNHIFWAFNMLRFFHVKQQKEIMQKTKWKSQLNSSFSSCSAIDIKNFTTLFAEINSPPIRKELLKCLQHINAFKNAVKENDLKKLLILSHCNDSECAELTKSCSDDDYIKLVQQNITMIEDLFMLVHFSARCERTSIFEITACPNYIQELIETRELLDLPKQSIDAENLLEALNAKNFLKYLPTNHNWSIWGQLLYILLKNINFPPEPIVTWLEMPVVISQS